MRPARLPEPLLLQRISPSAFFVFRLVRLPAFSSRSIIPGFQLATLQGGAATRRFAPTKNGLAKMRFLHDSVAVY